MIWLLSFASRLSFPQFFALQYPGGATCTIDLQFNLLLAEPDATPLHLYWPSDWLD